MRDTVVVTAQQLGGGDKRPSTAATGNAAFNADGSRGSTAVAPPLRSSSRSVKNRSKTLLRELCVDKDYLEQLTIDPNIVSAIQETDNYILSEVKDGINFLNGREEFWKQQKLIT